MFRPKFKCSKCKFEYYAEQSSDGSTYVGLCPNCPQEASTAWDDLVRAQREERERRKRRRA